MKSRWKGRRPDLPDSDPDFDLQHYFARYPRRNTTPTPPAGVCAFTARSGNVAQHSPQTQTGSDMLLRREPPRPAHVLIRRYPVVHPIHASHSDSGRMLFYHDLHPNPRSEELLGRTQKSRFSMKLPRPTRSLGALYGHFAGFPNVPEYVSTR